MGSNKRKDLIGKRFGTLTCTKYLGDGRWEVKCDCGKVKSIRGWDITSGRVKSCGVCGHIIDISGQTFGEWKVINYAGDRKWNCICSCGKQAIVDSTRLRSGASKSCNRNIHKKHSEI